MPFIGNKPTAIPLSADDLEDNIISTAKIQDNAVTPAKYIEPIPFRNIIINGDMSIAQRGTSQASITSTQYLLDRHLFNIVGQGTWTMSQDTDVPSGQGFYNSFKLACTTADASPAAADYLQYQHRLEGQMLQYIKKGTSNAESLTCSFWVKSNKTGTYIAELYDIDNTRQISKSYTIDSADTWEKKTLTFVGDTTGALDNNNARSFDLNLFFGAGSDRSSGTLNTSWGANVQANRAVGQVNLADSTSNYINITGVQLEAGTTASDFEFLPYDVNLGRCQRYYQKSFDIGTAPAQNIGIQTGELSFPSTKGSSTATTISQKYNFPVRMRASPTMTGYNSNSANSQVRDVTASADCSSTSFASNKETGFYVSCTTSSSTSVGNYLSIHFTASAEL